MRQPVFRALWIAAFVSNLGTLMQGVAAAWLMTSLTTSPLPVALLQTAGSLPLFLVGLPAGALADVVDRRWLVLITQIWMLVVAVVLGVLTLLGMISAWSLLLLTFLLGLGGALSAPAWQAIIPDLVDRHQLAAAVALNSASFNLARAVGPAAGGLIVAGTGPGSVFLINAVSFLGIMLVIYRWKTTPKTGAQPEGVRSAVQTGVRYVLYSPPLQVVLVRTAVVILGASALWALLPVVATRELKQSALGYGILLGSIGIGAVLGAFILPRIRDRFSADWQLGLSALIFASSLLVLGFVRNIYIVNAAMVAIGVGWIMMTSSLNVAAQLSTPRWVQARALGSYLLTFNGCLALGSAGWGTLSDRFGNPIALLVAAIFLVLGLVVGLRWRLTAAEGLDFTPSGHWRDPEIAVAPEPDAGPVLVTVEYRIADSDVDAFLQAMEQVRRFRRRDGATTWSLYQDPAQPGRYLETFTATTWAEHMRQHDRPTMLDRDIENEALRFHRGGSPPVVSHLVAVRPAGTGRWFSGGEDTR